jgi:hypothetical protein
MISRNRFHSLAVTVLVASLVLAGACARAATITHFEGQFTNGPSTSEPGPGYGEKGTGQQIFYLSFGIVSLTQESSPDKWLLQSLNDLTVNLSAFTTENPFGTVAAFSGDPMLLQVRQTVASDPQAAFTMADTAKITSNGVDHATIEIGVTLRPFPETDPKGDDLSTFITAGGGTFTIDLDNVQITPATDGQVFFPVGAGPITWSINPLPEPSSAVSMLIGAGLLALWARRRRPTIDKVTR